MANYLIIAASSGIGQALVHQLRDAGHQVLTTARDSSKITADFMLDATDFDAVDQAVANAMTQSGGLHGLVNCAGSLWLKPAHGTSRAQFQQVIDASLTTAFATVRAAGKLMTQGGSVALVSSAAAQQGLANHEAIAAAKAGIEGLVRAAAATYASQNLRINAVAPGLTETPLTAAITTNDMSRKFSLAMHGLARFGKADDVARALAFLVDPRNDWITGQVLGVDGGLGSMIPKPRI